MYQARWYSAAGKRLSATFDTLEDAVAFREERNREKRMGGSADLTGAKILLADWWEIWARRRQVAVGTSEQMLSYSKNHILPTFGHVRIGDIRRSDIEEWMVALADKDLAPSTRRKILQILTGGLNVAVSDERLLKNPALGVTRPKVDDGEARFLLPDELADLEECTDKWWRLTIPFMADTGLRIGELSAVRVCNIDILRGSVKVTDTRRRGKKGPGQPAGLVLGPPKSRHGRRVVPTLTRSVADRTAAHIAERDLGPEDFVFAGPRGGVLDPNNFRESIFNPAVQAAGLAEPYPTPHSLRHSAISLWIATGTVDLWKLATWAGHRDIELIRNTYGHLIPEEPPTATQDALDEIRRAAVDSRAERRRHGEVVDLDKRREERNR